MSTAGMETLRTWHGCINIMVHVKSGEFGELLMGQYRAKP
uniref:Uncharacterized protein n=1 Tax=Citrobacter phage NS1 TaxID=2766968 RepID=A0A7G9IRD5_9CAUD